MGKSIVVISVEECTEILKKAGLKKINQERLRLGLEQQVYPFGNVIQCRGRKVFEIYSSLLEKWIEERIS